LLGSVTGRQSAFGRVMVESDYGTQGRAMVVSDITRTELIRRAFRLEWFTVGWMTIESVVAIASGMTARSISLMAFGLDSLIELVSAGVLIWRLSVELKHGRAFSENAERTASRIASGLLFALAAYVVAAAGWGLWWREGQVFFWPGLAVTVLAIPACTCWQSASSPWPHSSAAVRCAPMP
jgi:hypothetical protein